MVLWVFGYGSLIWTPCFRYEERLTGFIKDFRRSFVRTEGGLTLTLEPQEGAITGGVAYRVTASVEQQILASYLSEMEAGESSSSLMLDFFTLDSCEVPAITGALTYIAAPESSNGGTSLWYLGKGLSPLRDAYKRGAGLAGNQTAAAKITEHPYWSRVVSANSKQDPCRDQECF